MSTTTFSKREIKLTPDFAQEYVHEFQETGFERKLSAQHVDRITKEMLRGSFLFDHLNIAVANFDSKKYRINGLHCCAARLALKDHPEFSQTVTLLEYDVKTNDELRSLYVTFDHHGRPNHGHVILRQFVGCEGWENVSRVAIMSVLKGFQLWKWEDAQERKTHDAREVAYLLQTEYLELGVKVGAFLTSVASNCYAKYFRSAPVVAAMLGTFAKDPKAAVEFWQPVIDGFSLSDVSDVRYLLREKLISNSASGAIKQEKEMILGMCIDAWNCFRQGKNG